MEANKKLNDCYFYYYSKCTKGDTCQFRHEPSALGCETMCYHWQQGNCQTAQCKFRHMELKKNRKQIPCYWETQPGGCLKKHCPFLHKNSPGGSMDNALIPQPISPQIGQPIQNMIQEQQIMVHNMSAHNMPGAMTHPAFQRPSRRPVVVTVPQDVLAPPHNRRPAPDTLLVHLQEEESDSESVPSSTPVKDQVKVKSLEQIRLERIQAEAAAYYSYDSTFDTPSGQFSNSSPSSDDRSVGDKKFPESYIDMSLDEIHNASRQATKRASKNSDDIKIFTLDEIKAKRRKIDFNSESFEKIMNENLRKNRLQCTMEAKADVDDDTLMACLKTINCQPVGKVRKLRKTLKNDNGTAKSTKPKLIRNRCSYSDASMNSSGSANNITNEDELNISLIDELKTDDSSLNNLALNGQSCAQIDYFDKNSDILNDIDNFLNNELL